MQPTALPSATPACTPHLRKTMALTRRLAWARGSSAGRLPASLATAQKAEEARPWRMCGGRREREEWGERREEVVVSGRWRGG